MMNKKEIFKKIGSILSELNEQHEYLSQSPDYLNELELELFSANANFLSDHLSILVKLNESEAKNNINPASLLSTSHPKAKLATDLPVEKEMETVPDWKIELEKEPGLKFEFEEKQTDKLFDRPLTDEEKRVIDEKTRIKTEEGVEKEYYNFEEEGDVDPEELEIEDLGETGKNVYEEQMVITEGTVATPVELMSEEHPGQTVNDILSRNISQQTVAGQFNSRQVKDLKGMISLNDKLLFVRDLFNGYSLAYSEALELLNRFDNFEAADNFLKQNYATKNNWADKQDVTDKFYEVLNRRFSK